MLFTSPPVRIWALMAPFIALISALGLGSGCTATGSNTLLVMTREAANSQYLPDEFERLLDSLGYEWVPVTDPDIGHPVKIATIYSEYRMQFRSRDAPGIRIDVHIRQDGQSAGLHFYQNDNKSLDAAAARRYQQLRERLELEFGSSHVVDNRTLMTP
jgi:hypothetical protein